jgi:hypothetical protein
MENGPAKTERPRRSRAEIAELIVRLFPMHADWCGPVKDLQERVKKLEEQED